MTQDPARFRITLDELEASVHVPVEDQVSAQADPPTPDLLGPDEIARLSMLRLGGAGI